MNKNWQLAAFPLILPWRSEFWTLPLYFPDLKVGVILDWPSELPYQGMPLPPAAAADGREIRNYRPGELQQWKAFEDFQASREDTADIIRQLRGEPLEPHPTSLISGDPWTLAWQLEKMQADQEAQMVLVDQGQQWLTDMLTPESWEPRLDFGTVPGLKEIIDPELARLRVLLWQRVLKPQLTPPWAVFLLGRTARAVFAALLEPAERREPDRVRLVFPGCRSAAEWQAVQERGGSSAWLAGFTARLSACLGAAADFSALQRRAQDLSAWLAETVVKYWPPEARWKWEMEIWAGSQTTDEGRPVLCWLGAGADILPG